MLKWSNDKWIFRTVHTCIYDEIGIVFVPFNPFWHLFTCKKLLTGQKSNL